MSELTLWIVCFGGVLVGAVIIIVLSNWLNDRWNQKRAKKMAEDMRNGTYDPDKKYFGDQGGWEPGDQN